MTTYTATGFTEKSLINNLLHGYDSNASLRIWSCNLLGAIPTAQLQTPIPHSSLTISEHAPINGLYVEFEDMVDLGIPVVHLGPSLTQMLTEYVICVQRAIHHPSIVIKVLLTE